MYKSFVLYITYLLSYSRTTFVYSNKKLLFIEIEFLNFKFFIKLTYRNTTIEINSVLKILILLIRYKKVANVCKIWYPQYNSTLRIFGLPKNITVIPPQTSYSIKFNMTSLKGILWDNSNQLNMLYLVWISPSLKHKRVLPTLKPTSN